jgi:hypothetical protein
MAVCTAYAPGMHLEEMIGGVDPKQTALRKMIWRSLFVMDIFLAHSSGRPVAIDEGECSGNVLAPMTNERTALNDHHVSDLCTVGLDATVTSSRVLSVILKKVYIPCKISTQLDQELDEVCRTWPQNLPPVLHWRRASPENRGQAIAILHANMVYFHSLILLTRPFFLLVLSEEVKQ